MRAKVFPAGFVQRRRKSRRAGPKKQRRMESGRGEVSAVEQFAVMLALSACGPSWWQAGGQEAVELAGVGWRAETQRPQDLWLESNAGPQGAPALVARVFPGQHHRWVSQPLPVEGGRAYLFSALVQAELAQAEGRLELSWQGAQGEELAVASSRPIFGRHGWARYEAASLAPAQAKTALMRLSVQATGPQAAGRVLMAQPQWARSVEVSVHLTARGNVLRPGEQAEARLELAGLADHKLVDVRWGVLDFDRQPVPAAAGVLERLGQGPHTFQLPALPPGYYTLQLQVSGAGLATRSLEASLAVVEPLPRRPPPDYPICLDAGMSWSYPPQDGAERLELACYLCALAGLRQLRDRLSWTEVERQPGKFDWGRYALAATAQQKHGLTVYQIFHDCPPWAQPPVEGGQPATQYPPRDPLFVYRFVNRLVRDLGDRVRYFEVWNEPNIGFFLGHPWDYAALLKAAYLGAKDADPAFGVLIGSATGLPGEFYRRVYENGAGDYFDIYNQHSYDAPEDLFGLLAVVRQQLQEHGLADKPLWITEMGMRAFPGPQGEFWPVEREQASYLVRAYACALANGVRRFHYFYLCEFLEGSLSLWGIVRSDLTPKPTYVALCTLIRQLGEARCVGWKQVGQRGYMVAFERDGGEVVLVAWDPAGAELKVPATGPVVGVVGQELVPARPRPGLTVKLGPLPVYVRGVAAADVPALSLTAPVLARDYHGEPDAHLAAKHIFLQAEVAPDRPRPPAEKMEQDKLAVALSPGEEVRVGAWVNNYRDQPAQARVECEVEEGLELLGAQEAELQIQPWARARHDFTVRAAHWNLAPGEVRRVRLRMTAAGRTDVACVYFRARQGYVEPQQRHLLFDGQKPALWQPNHAGSCKLELAGDETVRHAGPAALRVHATILSSADAWVFPILELPPEVDLSHYRGLELWTYVAPGGESGCEIHVQLIEEGGGVWIIPGVRSCAQAGWRRGIIALHTAQPTLWGPDPDGRLDLSKVRRLMVGWGGYTGRPGEEITFWIGEVAAVNW
jgi:hypothetical protein